MAVLFSLILGVALTAFPGKRRENSRQRVMAMLSMEITDRFVDFLKYVFIK